MGALTLLATLLMPILAAPPTGGPACKAETIAVVDKALSKMRPDRQHTFAFRGVAEACSLPPALARGTLEVCGRLLDEAIEARDAARAGTVRMTVAFLISAAGLIYVLAGLALGWL